MKPLFLFLIFFSAFAKADFQWSSSLDFSYINLDDPDGGDSAIAFIPHIGGTFDLSQRGQRVTTGIGYVDFSLDAGTSTVGQNVSGFSVFGNWERRTPISRDFSELYLTAGGKILQLEQTERHTITSDGFLQERLEDKSTSNIILSIGANYAPFSRSSKKSLDHHFGVFLDLPLSSEVLQFGARYQTYF